MPGSAAPSFAISRPRAAAFGALRDLGLAGGEEFLLLQLDALPRRVAEHDIEAAGRHHVGKFERPMEGAGLAGEVLRPADERAVDGAAGERVPDMRRRRDRHRVAVRRHAAGLRRQERGGVEVGGDLQAHEPGSARPAAKRRRFAAISSGLSSGIARKARASPRERRCRRQPPAARGEVEIALAFALGLVR